MDEKELYIKDNEASRAELNEAIDDLLMCTEYYTTCCEQSSPVVLDAALEVNEARTKLHLLLDILYARLYLAECPF